MMGLSRILTVIVIILFVTGGLVLVNGISKISISGADVLSEGFVLHNIISKILQGQSITEATIAKTTIDPVRDVEGSIDVPINHKNGTIVGSIYSNIKLYTREAWTAENEIRYDITSIVTGTDKVVDIFFYTTYNATRSMDDMKKTGYKEFKEENTDEGIIPLDKEENTNRWSHQGNFTMPLKGNLAFVGGYGIENTGYPMITETFVELEAASVKIQADASRAIIEQINQTTKTNHKIEGLTWILISVIPIGFGFEIILREYYHNKQKPRTHMEFLR